MTSAARHHRQETEGRCDGGDGIRSSEMNRNANKNQQTDCKHFMDDPDAPGCCCACGDCREAHCSTCAGEREIRDDAGGRWTCYACSPSTQLAIYTKADVEALVAIALAAERKLAPQNRVANLNKEVLEALERFVRAEKAWMDAKAPMEERAPGTFEDPLSDAYSHAVAVLNKLPRCHNLGPRVPMIQHERPTCGLFHGHAGDHTARCLNGQWLNWPATK